MNAWGACALVLGGLLALLAAAGAARRAGLLTPELARKSVHAGLGTACAAFPWIFTGNAPVFALAAVALLSLLALRFMRRRAGLRGARIGAALHEVERSSLGELWFPVAVALVWWLSAGDPARYSLPVLILAWADAAAAMVGVRFGSRRYSTDDGCKSWEGSLAFLMTASALTAVACILGGESDPVRIAGIALTVGLFSMGVEAVSRNGADNLLIPVACWAQLRVYETLPTSALLLRATILSGAVMLVCARRRITPLNDAALFAAYLAVYLFWALGGATGLVASGACLAVYTAINRLRPVARDDGHDVAGVAAAGFPGALALAAGIASGAGAENSLPGAFGAAAAVLTYAHFRAPARGARPALIAVTCGLATIAAAAGASLAWPTAEALLSAPLSVALAALLWRKHLPGARCDARIAGQMSATLPATILLILQPLSR